MADKFQYIRPLFFLNFITLDSTFNLTDNQFLFILLNITFSKSFVTQLLIFIGSSENV